jgi:hypothetical protein
VKRLDRCFHGSEATDHEDRNALPPATENLHDLDAVDAGHSEVQKNEIEAPELERLHPLLATPRFHHTVPFFPQESGGGNPERPVVVHEENAVGSRKRRLNHDGGLPQETRS